MRAVRFAEFGGPEKLQVVEVAKPEPGPDEVLVRVAYCGVNPVDRSVVTGRWDWMPKPHTPGSEVSGIVESAGSLVTHVKPGDRVALALRLFCGTCHYCQLGREEACNYDPRSATAPYAYGIMTDGGYADYILAPGRNAVPVPGGVPLDAAACAALDGLTAWHMLDRARVAAGERVLVWGASGGLGTFFVQMARLRGAVVYAVTSRTSETDRLRRLGASEVIDRTSQDVARTARQLTGGRGVDVALDPLGAASWDASMGSLAPLGRYATCGILTGPDVTLRIPPFYAQQQEVIGSTGGTRADLGRVLDSMARGAVEAVVWKELPLEQAAQAMAELGARDRFGKILLKVAAPS